ncbi:MAG: hypothetical protein IPN86_08050 [Saprospiraceae bacterium]|nr:hypothetical protein [Saprospiraceae bacterium]
MTIVEKIFYTLNEASKSLLQLNDNFYLIGSSALALTGIELDKMYDLDILVSERDAEFLKEEWHNKLLKAHITSDNRLFSSKFARYKFSVLDIEIMGDLKVFNKERWQRLEIATTESILVGNVEIKFPTLNEQKRILQLFGREKDKQRIKLIDNLLT